MKVELECGEEEEKDVVERWGEVEEEEVVVLVVELPQKGEDTWKLEKQRDFCTGFQAIIFKV